MVVRPFWLCVLIEMAVLVALAWGLGVGWTLLILVTTFLLGLALAGAQIRRQVRRLRAGMTIPQPRDGHHPIIEMQLGPVRFAIDPKNHSARRSFTHRLIVRETPSHLAGDQRRMPRGHGGQTKRGRTKRGRRLRSLRT